MTWSAIRVIKFLPAIYVEQINVHSVYFCVCKLSFYMIKKYLAVSEYHQLLYLLAQLSSMTTEYLNEMNSLTPL